MYERIESSTLRADEVPNRVEELRRVLEGTRIVLSTLSMLSNPAFDQNGMFLVAPVERIVVDEASQINVFDYMVAI